MPDLLKRSLMRSLLIIVTILGALFVFGVVHQAREGVVETWQIVAGIVIIVALVLVNRWWMRRTGTRI